MVILYIVLREGLKCSIKLHQLHARMKSYTSDTKVRRHNSAKHNTSPWNQFRQSALYHNVWHM